MMTSRRLLAPILVSLLAVVSAHAADPLAGQLRAEVEKARANLGELPAWQEEIFQNEVLASSGRFIRDYKSSGNKVTKVDVDLEGIKRYLSFTSSQILKPDANKVLLFVRANSSCTDCGKSLGNIRQDLKERLERRGLVVLLATADEMKREPTEAYAKRNAAGWVLANVREEADPDHGGDSRYNLLLDFHFPGTVASSVQKQMEILPSESLEIAMSRLAIDAFLEMGAKARTAFAASNVESDGIELAVEGLTRFQILSQMKSKLQAALGNDYRVVEKRIERGGHAALSIKAGASGEERASLVSDALRKTKFEGFTVEVLNEAGAKVTVRVNAAKGAA
jgi:hypothetical protein